MKSSSLPEPGTSAPALIFIPDISGFTRFVTETEINHAQHIISELLEILMDANKVGLNVSEVEGDAILFYRFGKAPSAGELMDQVKEMFYRFHKQLNKYETHRICNCGACCTANKLTIKFVSHYGDIAINEIRNHKKLFGKEVIVAHRLLKNDIDSNEYALFTDDIKNACDSWNSLNDIWGDFVNTGHEYDSGKVGFSYISMAPLLKSIPALQPEDYSIQGMKSRAMDVEFIVEAPFESVFNVIADIPFRAKWLPGVMEEITDINTSLTQAGQSHKCLAKGPVIVSHDYQISAGDITFTETVTDKSYCVVYNLKKLDDNKTLLHCTVFLKKHILKDIMFKLFMKKKLRGIYLKAFTNLNEYCKTMVEKKSVHPYSIQLSETRMRA